MPPSRLRALISTINPVDGGVPTMTRWMVSVLEELSVDLTFVWYQPWSISPDLSVPLHRILSGRRPGSEARQVYGAHSGYGIGAWLPELEFTHYLPRRSWRALISSSDILLSVTGNPLSAVPFARLGLPFLAWVASPWAADREDRAKSFSPPRRLLDNAINAPVLRQLERQVLRAPTGTILPLSSYTSRSLEVIAERPMKAILRMPVETDRFYPSDTQTIPWRIGFVGRYLDPRKNIHLLLEALHILLNDHNSAHLYLIGEPDVDSLSDAIDTYGLGGKVHCFPRTDRESLPTLLQSFDVFAVPSHQEGLCIAALEAMACGVPVVSTRCGGPEDYVIPDRTGILVESSPIAMAEAIASLCNHRQIRSTLAQGALAWVKRYASPEKSRETFLLQLSQQYPSILD